MNPAPPDISAPDHPVSPALTQERKQKIKDALVAVAMANWCFVRPSFDLLFDADRYFNKLPVQRFELLALAANIAGLSLILWAGIRYWRRIRKTSFVSLALEMLFLMLFVFPVDFLRQDIFQVTDAVAVAFLKRHAVMCSLGILAMLALWKHRLASRVAAMCVAVTSPVALVTLGKSLVLCMGVIHIKQCDFSQLPPPMLAERQDQARVIWIIFDETDYRMVFEKHPASVALPAFDRLRAESLSADTAYAPGDATLVSMPALITGRRLSDVALDACDLTLTLADTGAKAEWSAMPSVFSEARQLGVNTALVGWYHPYSHVLGNSLTYCSWYPFPLFEPARSTTLGGSIRRQIASLAGPFRIRQIFSDVCRQSLRDSLSLVADPRYGCVLLHMPPPHGPGVWLPEDKRFTCLGMNPVTGYFNNLVLADKYLAKLRQALDASGLINHSWIILSADHSWRKSSQYDHIRDYRVPFLVRPPGQGGACAYSRPFNTVLTHDLILAILRGSLTNSPGVAAWLDVHGKPDMPVGAPRHKFD